MINIIENLPSPECRNCKQCILSVDEQIFMSDSYTTEKRIVVSCKNSAHCVAEKGGAEDCS